MRFFYDTELTVSRYDVLRPCQQIGNPLTLGLPGNPKLQIVRMIIQSVAIEMVHVFIGVKRPTKKRFHNVPMLQNPLHLRPIGGNNPNSTVSARDIGTIHSANAARFAGAATPRRFGWVSPCP
jgi:hypothetical protein